MKHDKKDKSGSLTPMVFNNFTVFTKNSNTTIHSQKKKKKSEQHFTLMRKKKRKRKKIKNASSYDLSSNATKHRNNI